MAYAQGRTYYDADSHIMELPDFLREFADPEMRDRLPRHQGAAGGRLAECSSTQRAKDKARPEGAASTSCSRSATS